MKPIALLVLQSFMNWPIFLKMTELMICTSYEKLTFLPGIIHTPSTIHPTQVSAEVEGGERQPLLWPTYYRGGSRNFGRRGPGKSFYNSSRKSANFTPFLWLAFKPGTLFRFGSASLCSDNYISLVLRRRPLDIQGGLEFF